MVLPFPATTSSASLGVASSDDSFLVVDDIEISGDWKPARLTLTGLPSLQRPRVIDST